MILPKDFTNNSISYSNNSELKICILAFLFPFQLETSGNLDACTKQIENRAEKLKLEILIYLKVWFDKVSRESPKIWISIQVHLNLNLN